MKVKLKVYGYFRSAIPEDEVQFSFKCKITLADFIQEVVKAYPSFKDFLPEGDFTQQIAVTINNRLSGPVDIVGEGDVISFLPPLS